MESMSLATSAVDTNGAVSFALAAARAPNVWYRASVRPTAPGTAPKRGSSVVCTENVDASALVSKISTLGVVRLTPLQVKG